MTATESMLYAQYKGRVESELNYLFGKRDEAEREIEVIDARIKILQADQAQTKEFVKEGLK